MSKKYRVAIIGIDHVHATQLYNQFNQYAGDRIEWLGFADTTDCSEELAEFKLNLNFYNPDMHKLKRYKDYRELLDENPDIAIVCTDIASHSRICEETLARNIHTIVEKPMATTLDDGIRMYRAAKKSEATLVINWPVAWFTAFEKAKALLDTGIIGDAMRFHYRSPATRGPYNLEQYTKEQLTGLWWYDKKRGGGSIMDYAGYGTVLSTWFMDDKLPISVSGFKKNFMMPFSDVEDYTTFTFEYENAISIIEGSWSTINNGQIATGPVVYGTEGVIVADRYDTQVKVYKDLAPYKPSTEPTEIFESNAEATNISVNLMDYLEKGTPLNHLVTVDFNIRAMAALDAGIRSTESGKVERVIKKW